MTLLDQLKKFTIVVADTGDFETMKAHAPQDATTNPSLILKAVQKAEYQPLLEEAIRNHPSASANEVIDELLILFGRRILEIIPGRVSTEADARLSFDTEGTIQKARHLISLYEKAGIPRERVLIKIASTWEGVRAAEQLEKEGIHCNMTLLFSFPQAVACAQVGAKLISPFVGRIYDWFKKHDGLEFTGAADPGVRSVRLIYNYYKKFGHKTEVMGASFRNISQILELAGCDLLTISPDLLAKLSMSEGIVERKLSAESALNDPVEEMVLDEKSFRLLLNDDAMATEKLAEGIRLFAADTVKLEKIIVEKQ